MTDRPILFSAPMVRALLEGRKTQTRRVFKPRGFRFYTHPVAGDRYEEFDRSGVTGGGQMAAFCYGSGLYGYLPYAPGDRLWVREAWRTSKVADELAPRMLVGGGYSRIWHEADRDNCDAHGRLRPGIHMPRWACRLTLLVTDVRVQRLQDITREDAIAEGVHRVGGGMLRWENWSAAEGLSAASPQSAFAVLWNSINGDDAWNVNPWVAAISFEVVRANIDQVQP